MHRHITLSKFSPHIGWNAKRDQSWMKSLGTEKAVLAAFSQTRKRLCDFVEKKVSPTTATSTFLYELSSGDGRADKYAVLSPALADFLKIEIAVVYCCKDSYDRSALLKTLVPMGLPQQLAPKDGVAAILKSSEFKSKLQVASGDPWLKKMTGKSAAEIKSNLIAGTAGAYTLSSSGILAGTFTVEVVNNGTHVILPQHFKHFIN